LLAAVSDVTNLRGLPLLLVAGLGTLTNQKKAHIGQSHQREEDQNEEKSRTNMVADSEQRCKVTKLSPLLNY
jgi:hypothetical protein